MLIKRGDLFYADLNPSFGSEQGGIRPVLVVQNNIGNMHSPTLVVLPITSSNKPPFSSTSLMNFSSNMAFIIRASVLPARRRI